jgi:hypothetical protein
MGREKSKKTIRTEVASLRAEGLADGGVMVVVVLSRASVVKPSGLSSYKQPH